MSPRRVIVIAHMALGVSMPIDLPESKLTTVEAYKRAVKAMRRLANGFDPVDGYDLRNIQKLSDISPARRRRIREYWEQARVAESQGLQIVRSRSKTRLKAVQEYSGLEYKKSFKVAFVEKKPDEKIKYKKVDGKIKVKGFESIVTGITNRRVLFNKNKLIKDERDYLTKLLDKEMTKNDLSIVINGEYTIRAQPKNKGAMVDYIVKLMNDYGDTYKQWLNGIVITSGPSLNATRQYTQNRSIHYNKTSPIRKELYDLNRALQKAEIRFHKKPSKRNKNSIRQWMEKKVKLIKELRELNAKYGFD